MWLHIDAAYAGTAAITPELREQMPGLELADSLVTNRTSGWFVPVDCSILFVRDAAECARSVFDRAGLPDDDRAGRHEPDGLWRAAWRRFRGVEGLDGVARVCLAGLRERQRYHCALAREFAEWVTADARFELCAPVNFSTVCFRTGLDLSDEEADRLNERILAHVNAVGAIFISHTRLKGRL